MGEVEGCGYGTMFFTYDDGAGYFTATSVPQLRGWHDPVFADVDGDGDPDLLLSGEGGYPTPSCRSRCCPLAPPT